MAKTEQSVRAVDQIAAAVVVLRGQRVILDADLAALYGVTTKRLNEQVKRNASRFPQDFSFRLRRTEVDTLNRSQIATGSQKHRDPRFPPLVFTEHGAIMAATVLNSERAVEMSVYVVRAFVRLRELLNSNTELARRLNELEGKLEGHDATITAILDAIRELMSPPAVKRRAIGFTADVEPSSRLADSLTRMYGEALQLERSQVRIALAPQPSHAHSRHERRSFASTL